MFIAFGLLLSVNLINAQMSYADKKDKYYYENYVWQKDDRYDPVIASAFSFLVPGLGQVISGEVNRGIGFFAGHITSVVIFSYSVISYANKPTKILLSGEEGKVADGRIVVSGGIVIGIWIWSIIDACQVAKVNNLYFRDIGDHLYFRRAKLINLKPSLNILPDNNVGYGLSFAISF
ncbi:hypothetical protein ES705_14516 [subsurface metagenome]